MKKIIVCLPKLLPRSEWENAAQNAIAINPRNRLQVEQLPDVVAGPALIAALTSKYWGITGVHLTVGFLDSPPSDLRRRIMLHMNAWGTSANVDFVETTTAPQVRIARIDEGKDRGYWSYLGTDIDLIPRSKPTMNLEGFTMSTPDSEFYRVVRHETGHTMGFPHEHLRREIADRIDAEKAIRYFRARLGWTRQQVQEQVLTPIEESELRGTPRADTTSIMSYQLPGSIMKDGVPVLGGLDINSLDHEFAAILYPSTADAPVRSAGTAARPSRAPHEGAGAANEGAPLLCFAPGTDPSYVAGVIASLRGSRR